MEPTQWQKSLRFYAQALAHLEEQLVQRTSRFAPFHSLFSELVKHIDRFSNALTALTDAIDNHILSERILVSTQSLNPKSYCVRNSCICEVDSQDFAMRSNL